MKYYLLPLLLFFALPVLPQNNSAQVQTRIDSLLAGSFFDTTQISVDVYDLTSKINLYRRNEKYLLRPASNMKILTTSAALVFLGPDYNFTTSLYYTGEIKNEILYGDIYVVGGCDPDFTTKDLDLFASVIKAAGISEIRGNLIGDVSMMDSLNWGKGWMWDDDCAYLTPLDINANSIGVIVKPGIIGQKAIIKLIPQTDFIEFNNSAVTVPADKPGTFTIDKDWLNHKNLITLKGSVSAKIIPDSLQDTIYIKIHEPEKYFLTLFRETLRKRGVNISGDNYIAFMPLYSKNLFSLKRKFRGVINNLNKESYNLGAEMTLRALAVQYAGKPATAYKGVRMIDSLITLTGLNPKSYRIVDGSGISHYNLVSTQLLLEVLKYMYFQKPELCKILYKSFPVAGTDGTLSNRMKDSPAQNRVNAKTGTLSGVSSLSGYITADNGHLLAFSIILQGFTGSAKETKDYEDKICSILSEYK
ncbi:MAG: D-alanyl-D-alanine carboxypeptidase/D-alanyl-D-alanine-endopeptidase [Ignavibacteriaceae bacterium]|nr:D-alanyl-D-alanine carboxypeptidase/D-alanyl-D-alanine-endopeptidase [Ignavibacteriaceae bacterium]